MDKALKNLPNFLTIFRLLVVPIFVYLLIDPSPLMLTWGTVLFILAAITDYFDGMVARRLKAVSDTGKLLDPLADKILVMAALVMLVGLRSDVDGEPWVPAWMVVVILAREMWVTGLRGIAASKGQVIAAKAGGKWKNALQIIAVVCLLAHVPIRFGEFVINFEALGINILFVSIAFALWSAGDYTAAVLKKI